MSLFRIPMGVFNWRVSATIVAAVAACFGSLLPRIVGQGGWPAGPASVGTVLGVALITGAAFFYSAWRLTRCPSTGWLVVGSLAVGTHLTVTGLSVLMLDRASGSQAAESVAMALLLAGLALAAAPGRQLTARQDPSMLGVAAGAMTAVLGQLGGMLTRGVAPGAVSLVVPTVVALSGAACAWAAWHQLGASPWIRAHATLAVSFLAAQQVVPGLLGLRGTAASLLLAAVPAIVVVNAAILLLMAGIRDHRRAMDTLRNSVEELELRIRAERATLHEIRATVSGIGQATGLISRHDLTPDRRAKLLHMLDAEAHRLERLSHSDQPSAPEVVDVDPLVETLVLRQRLRGQDLHWQTSGHRVIAREDDVSEILSILLENSRRHAPGSTVLVEVRAAGDALHLAVSDTGPGVPARLRGDLFEWGVRRPGSPGQGIGLAMARQLARQLGGDVVLVGHGPGATFRVTLPAGESPLRLESQERRRVVGAA